MPGTLRTMGDLFDGYGSSARGLTEVAFAITGTRWSGPRFFGLRDRPKKPA